MTASEMGRGGGEMGRGRGEKGRGGVEVEGQHRIGLTLERSGEIQNKPQLNHSVVLVNWKTYQFVSNAMKCMYVHWRQISHQSSTVNTICCFISVESRI